MVMTKKYLNITGPCVVKASDREIPSGVEIMNPDLVICNLKEVHRAKL